MPPADFDAEVWRLCLSPRLSVSLYEIESKWTLADFVQAHIALDVAEDMETLIDMVR
jgi:hypothetical protein